MELYPDLYYYRGWYNILSSGRLPPRLLLYNKNANNLVVTPVKGCWVLGNERTCFETCSLTLIILGILVSLSRTETSITSTAQNQPSRFDTRQSCRSGMHAADSVREMFSFTRAESAYAKSLDCHPCRNRVAKARQWTSTPMGPAFQPSHIQLTGPEECIQLAVTRGLLLVCLDGQ